MVFGGKLSWSEHPKMLKIEVLRRQKLHMQKLKKLFHIVIIITINFT